MSWTQIRSDTDLLYVPALLTTSESYYIYELLKFSRFRPPFEIAIRVANISGAVPLRSAVLRPTLSLSGDETNYRLVIM